MNWPTDYAKREDKLYPNLYEIREKAILIQQIKRYLPAEKHWMVDSIAKEIK